MKQLIWFFSLGLICTMSFAQSRKLIGVKVYSVNEDLLTTFSIDCNNFETSFNKGQIRQKQITGTVVLDIVAKTLGTVTLNNDKSSFNVRTKYYLKYSDGSMQVICSDKFKHIKIDGRTIKNNNEIVPVLTSLKS